jgi:hypothetical protein
LVRIFVFLGFNGGVVMVLGSNLCRFGGQWWDTRVEKEEKIKNKAEKLCS